MNKKVLLEAPILTQSGYGEHSRLVFKALKTNPDLDVYIMPLGWGSTSWVQNFDPEIEECIKKCHQYIAYCNQNKVQNAFDAQIRVGIPNEFEKKAPYSVVVSAGIETDRVSWSWILKTHQGIDKLVVTSKHSKDVYEGTTYEVENRATETMTEVTCNCPIEVVPYPIKNTQPADINLDLETDFNFLNIGLLGPRKNIESCVEWFIKEFKDEENAGLILKTALAKGSLIDRENTTKILQNITDKYPEKKCKIYLLHGHMTEEEIHSLYVNPKIKAFVTTTCGEGFGLPLFEAAYSAMPIVATDWSSYLDFLTAPVRNKKTKKIKNKKLFAAVECKLGPIPKESVWQDILVEGAQWAYANELSFKKQIRNVYKNYNLYKSWAQKLKEHLLTTHSEDMILPAMLEALSLKQEKPEVIDWMASQQEVEVL